MEDDKLGIRNLDEEIKYKPKKNSGERAKFKVKKALKRPSPMRNTRNTILLIIALILIIGLGLFVFNLNNIFGRSDKLIATINGQNVYKSYSDRIYALEIPENQTISEREFTYNFLVPRILFLQEATAKNYKVTDDEVEEHINNLFSINFKKEDLIKQLKKEGITYTEFQNITRENMVISNLLANQVKTKIIVTDKEIKDFYERYKDTYNFPGNSSNISSNLKIAIQAQIYKTKELQGISLYFNQLAGKSVITIYDETIKANYGQSFKQNDQLICKKDSKPIIRFFSTSDCKSCDWARAAFKSAVEPYVEKGLVVAYNWQLDTGDDLMTSGEEKAIPKEEFEVYQKFSQTSVPTFVFGCKYYRVGNYYDTLKQEEEEFREIIKRLFA